MCFLTNCAVNDFSMFYKYLRSFKDILLIIGIIFHDK